jgi:dienelactone hydrolase
MLSVLIVTDIFGRCDGLQCLLADLAVSDVNIRIVDPYQGVFQRFSAEDAAYADFVQHCGHDRYTQKVLSALQKNTDVAIGFSAGASALWHAAAIAPGELQHLTLFYPGQLHQHANLTPKMPTELIFGATERHFSVEEMQRQLRDKNNIIVTQTAWQHGFMNLASTAFNGDAYLQFVAHLQAVITAMQHKRF